MPRVLIADKLSPAAVDIFKSAASTPTSRPACPRTN
jgi:hypothetical protein